MKNYLFILIGLIFGTQVSAQRFGIVDTELILTKVPEYKQAQSQLDQLSQQWQGEVESLQSEKEALQKAYNAERVLMTEAKRKENEAIIKAKEQEVLDLQRKYFGPDGEIFKKRQELIKPIQDKIYNAVQEVARRKKLDVVFNKSSDLTVLYNSKKADISDDVMTKLGY
jgi:outer membrane protein